MTEHAFGLSFPDLDPKRLRFIGSRALLAACHRHPDYTVRELRSVTRTDGSQADCIVVTVDNRQVPANNPLGICSIEVIALVHNEGAKLPYDARPLREGFPILLHQNAVLEGEPVSLCLYDQPWSIVERSWTPSRYLDRILWWLGQSALGELHAADQALEQLFYDDSTRLILPANFESTWVKSHAPMHMAAIKAENTLTLRAISPQKENIDAAIGLVVTVASIGHPPLSRQPATLGALVKYFEQQGSDLLMPLRAAVFNYWPEGSGALASLKQRTLLIIRVPRAEDQVQHRTDTIAVYLDVDLGSMGFALGVLDKSPDSARLFRSYSDVLTGKTQLDTDAWSLLSIGIAQTISTVSREVASHYSGITTDCNFNGVLGGLGALGSALFNVWFRSGWGIWTLIDSDTISPHNLVRHTAIDADIGMSKTHACATAATAIYPAEPVPRAIHGEIDARDKQEISIAFQDATLIVDATASLAAGRNLSINEHVARTASVFLSPSGGASVLLLEDSERQSRLVSLEAHYYRAILNAPWGQSHLEVAGSIRPGATCRDVSFVMPTESIQLHAAILARQLRLATQSATAKIGVWIQDELTAAVSHFDISVTPTREVRAGEWKIGWDEDIHDRLRVLRQLSLPNETGGILLGIIDTALKLIQVVDIVPAPSDSRGDTTSFIRGTLGLVNVVKEARRRTHGAVDYIGDWHSHPRGHSSQPSMTDFVQVAGLADRLDAEGIPALMCIVGEGSNDISWTLCHVDG